jgi:hypothetical protein
MFSRLLWHPRKKGRGAVLLLYPENYTGRKVAKFKYLLKLTAKFKLFYKFCENIESEWNGKHTLLLRAAMQRKLLLRNET